MSIDERLTDPKKQPPKKTMVKSILKFVYFEQKGGFNELKFSRYPSSK